MIDNQEIKERFVLVAAVTDDGRNLEESMHELAELTKTAGAEAVGRVVQMRESIHPGTYIGKGKIEEVRETINALDATGIICDDDLSPAQYNNLADMLDVKVMDRTMLILDIFAGRARTSEGKIQVELAQLRYRSARLTGIGRSMSRLGGGIGTRGPGEKKLEMDRRLIGKRISSLKEELAEVKRHRELVRARRREGKEKTCAIVGYTNAGKSTLLNYLTGAGILAEDALFATLDPTTRELLLPDSNKILLTDTVGFIRKLPHHLVDAFRSTLEEAAYADLILHVVDASNPNMDSQMQVVYETLAMLGAGDKPVYTLFNKIDREEANENHLTDRHAKKTFRVSAKYGEGIPELLDALSDFITEGQILIERDVPYAKAGVIARIRAEGQLLAEEYQAGGIYVKAYVPRRLYGQLLAELG
ncbi:MAG: GTPase HflX [Lachnospiraceae bacterium]|nr:GTPase HflX [Lachnospiraceae bacterium]